MASKQPTEEQLLYAAKAVYEARVIVGRYLQLPEGKLDAKLRELQLGYYRHAEAKSLERDAKAIELTRGIHKLRLEVRSYATEHGEPATPADLAAAGYVPCSELEAVRLELEQTNAAWHERWMRDQKLIEKLNQDSVEAAEQLTTERARAEEAERQLEQVCDVLYNTGATRGDALTRAKRALASYHEHLNEEVTKDEELERMKRELAQARELLGGPGESVVVPVALASDLSAERVALKTDLAAANTRIAEYKASEADWREQLREVNTRAGRLGDLARELGSEHEKLMAIARLAWAIRTDTDSETPGKLDEALECFDELCRSHLERIAKPYPYGEPALSAAPQVSTDLPLGVLSADDYESFQQMLNAPAKVVPALAEAMRRRRAAHQASATYATRDEADEAMGDYVESHPIGAPQASTEQVERAPGAGCLCDGCVYCHDNHDENTDPLTVETFKAELIAALREASDGAPVEISNVLYDIRKALEGGK